MLAFLLFSLLPCSILLWILYHYFLSVPSVNPQANAEFVKGKTVWITGASSGIGEALALYLRSSPSTRVVLSARNKTALESVATQLRSSGVKDVFVLPMDLAECADSSAVSEALVKQVLDKYKQIDLLIHNGGLGVRGDVQAIDLSVQIQLMKVNYYGCVSLTKAALPSMVARKSGSLVFMSSVQGKLSLAYRSAYSASKHAMNGFANALRYELQESGISVVILCPGYVKTPLSTNALNADGSRYGQMDDTNAGGYDASYIADVTYSCMRLGKGEVVVADPVARLGIMLSQLCPGLLDLVMKGKTRKEKKRLEALKDANATAK